MKKGVQGPLARSNNTPPPDLNYKPPPDEGLSVLHADDDILVLAKPAGLLSVPGNRPELQDCFETRAQTEYPTATTVHRLDRPTSGVFIMALNAEAHRNLGLQFEKRKTAKTYIAIVSGVISNEMGQVDQPLRTDWYNRPKQMVDNCLGRDAVTQWRVLERFPDVTRLELKPITGRSHQLRVHMQWLGHPIVGDDFYAPHDIASASNRLLLHAETLEISHPETGLRMQFTEPCPF